MIKNNTLYKLFLISTTVFSLSACQGPSQQDWQAFCQNDKWAEHGYFDATEGFPIKMANVYRDRCGDQFTDKDLERYQIGFIKGIREFCTQENGYKLGRANKSNPETCPPELQRPFLAGYQRGKADYVRLEVIKSQETQKYERWEDNNRPPPMQRERGE